MSPNPTASTPPTRAAQYVRMSTDHQRYSLDNQRAAIRAYAAHRGIEVVRSYEDPGRSGLTLKRRDALQQLLHDVLSEDPGFEVILVYDVSRWGRFQDTDESAYYEFHCRNAGIEIRYCGELFENDGSMSSTIFKSLKRAMAAEYSRELSSKVFAGQRHLVELGFWQGGNPGFGLRRMMCDGDGKPKGKLGRGEQKSLHTDRVIVVPGPDHEVAAVRWAFRAFTREGLTQKLIARELNRRGFHVPISGRRWSAKAVRRLLTNERYIGTNVYNRSTAKLAGPRRVNPKAQWVRRAGAFEPIVEEKVFAAAARRMGSCLPRTDRDLIAALKALFVREGKLNATLINRDRRCASFQTYIRRFGTIMKAYELVGYRPAQDTTWIAALRLQRQVLVTARQELGSCLTKRGLTWRIAPSGDWLIIDEVLRVAVTVVRRRYLGHGWQRWKLATPRRQRNTLHLAIRLTPDHREVMDYLLIPHRRGQGPYLWLDQERSPWIRGCRFNNLEEVASQLARPRRAAANMRERFRRWQRAAVRDVTPLEGPMFRRWTPGELAMLRSLAAMGEPPHLIGQQLCRSTQAVRVKASLNGISLAIAR